MTSRRQHTIPQFYLKLFLSPGFVYRLEADAPRRVHNPRDVAVTQDYYGRTTAERQSLDDINSKTENLGAPVFRQLIEDPSAFTQDDWETISCVLANIFVRTPAIIEEMNSTLLDLAEGTLHVAANMQERLVEALEAGSDLAEFPTMLPGDETPSMAIEEVDQQATRTAAEGGYRLTANVMFSAVPDIAHCIQRMRFLVLEAPPGLFFVTSDRPLVLRSQVNGSPVGAGWANRDVQATIPLHPTRYLFIFHGTPPGIEQRQATPQIVTELNSDTILFARREVYTPYEYPKADDWMKSLGNWQRA